MVEQIYQSIIDDMTWSYSRLKTFEMCPYQWYMRYILDLQTKPQFYSDYGSFMHRLLANYYSGEASKEDLASRFLLNFSSEVRGKRPSESTVERYIRDGAAFLENAAPLPYRPVAIEKKIDFKVSGRDFVCFIDYIGEKGGRLAVIDHKSRDIKQSKGRKKPTKKDMELSDMFRQLYLYSTAIHSYYGVYPDVLCFNCFRTGTLIEEPFSKKKHEEAMVWVDGTIKKIKCANKDGFWPNVEYFSCSNICGLNDDCCYWEASK